MTLSISEMKVRLEHYLTDMIMDAVENVNLFADIAENERLPDTIRRKAEEHCTYYRPRSLPPPPCHCHAPPSRT